MQKQLTSFTCLFFIIISNTDASAGAVAHPREVDCAPTRPGLCAAVTGYGEVLVTTDLGRRWGEPVKVSLLGALDETEPESEADESEGSVEPHIAICDSGLWIAVRGDRAVAGDSGNRWRHRAIDVFRDGEQVGWMPPVCDSRDRIWLFSQNETLVISSRAGQAMLAARFAIAATSAPVFDPITRRVLVPTRSGVVWIDAGEHLGRSGVAGSRRLSPIAVEPGSGRRLGVWSGRLWRVAKGAQPEELGPVPKAVTSLVVDRDGRTWCRSEGGTWWRLNERGFVSSNAEALAVDGTGRLLTLPDVQGSPPPPGSLPEASYRAPGSILKELGPPPCRPRGGLGVFVRFWGGWRQSGRREAPTGPGVFRSFLDGGASIGLAIGFEADPQGRGACHRDLESWSRRQQKKILEQARLLEALLRVRYRISHSAEPFEKALTELEAERIEHLLAVVERGTVAMGAASHEGEDL